MPSAQCADRNVTAANGSLSDCRRILFDVLRCVIELNARYQRSLVPALDVDEVIQRCIEVKQQLDVDFTALGSANGEVLLMS